MRLSHNDDHLPFAGGPDGRDEETKLLCCFFFSSSFKCFVLLSTCPCVHPMARPQRSRRCFLVFPSFTFAARLSPGRFFSARRFLFLLLPLLCSPLQWTPVNTQSVSQSCNRAVNLRRLDRQADGRADGAGPAVCVLGDCLVLRQGALHKRLQPRER